MIILASSPEPGFSRTARISALTFLVGGNKEWNDTSTSDSEDKVFHMNNFKITYFTVS